MSDTLTALIAAVVGLLSGAVGSLLAPWANWGVEKRRKRFDARHEIISRGRQAVARVVQHRDDGGGCGSNNR